MPRLAFRDIDLQRRLAPRAPIMAAVRALRVVPSLGARCCRSAAGSLPAAAPLGIPGAALAGGAARRRCAENRYPVPWPRARSLATAAKETSKTLVASAKGNSGRLAGAVASSIRLHGAVELIAVGPGATQTAVKAILLANKYLEDTLDGKTLAIIPGKRDVTDGDYATVAMELKVRPIPQVEGMSSVSQEPNFFCAGNTNVGTMAGLLATLVKKGQVPTIGLMGPAALSSGLKSSILLGEFVSDFLGSSHEIAVVPRRDEFVEQDETRFRIVLGVIRVEKLNAEK